MRRLPMLLAVIALTAVPGRAERIKDIVEIEGVRGNPIWGYGLVVGLNGTGDNSEASKRALVNILRHAPLVLEPGDISSKNIASVMVTAELGPFARRGSRIDVTVSAIGSANSLQGGTLLMAPLMGADQQVYAVAQGSITIGGFAASGKAGSVSKNHPTVGIISGGAIVEQEELADFVKNGRISLQLRYPDFSTVERIAQAINKVYPASSAAVDAGSVKVEIPGNLRQADLSGFIDRIGALEVEVDQPAVVIINERTGTIVVGEKVAISTVAISHGSLSIITKEREQVSQPLPLSRTGTTERVQRTDVTVIEQGGALQVVPRQVTVADLARALNAMGLTPRDLAAIFEALRKAGALQAELKIM